jgi:aminoglycoside phosphotransferase (APT) family kinase protein
LSTQENWLEIAAAACDHAGVECGSIETLVTWGEEWPNNAVFRLDGQRILKVYGPRDQRQVHIECAALRTLENNQAIPAPRLVAAGEPSEGRSYLVMTAIPGGETVDFWKSMARTELLAIAEEIGALFAAVHRLPQDELAAVARQFPDRSEHAIKRRDARRTAETIAATETLSVGQRDDLLQFLHEEAPQHLDGPPKVTHSDLSHHHVYLSREMGTWQVSGIIDWAEAALGPPEWDIACLWHWTFNGVWHATFTEEWEAMQACLRTFYAGQQPPERFARRCLAAFLHSPWVDLVWPHFLERECSSKDIVRDLTEYMFAPEVFGPSD